LFGGLSLLKTPVATGLHKRNYDKQKAIVVVEASLILGLPITWEMQGYANVANASQRHR